MNLSNDVLIPARNVILNTEGEIYAYDYTGGTWTLNHLKTHLNHLNSTVSLFIQLDIDMFFSPELDNLSSEQIVLVLPFALQLLPETIVRIDELHDKGYRFAFDGHTLESSHFSSASSLFPYIQFVRIDARQLEKPSIINAITRLRPYEMTFLATDIREPNHYKYCESYGFTLFEGSFYKKPLIIENKRVDTLTSKVLELIEKVQHNASLSEIEQIFNRYPDLLFNLLRHINSAAFGFTADIQSVRHALTLLGRNRLLSWLSLFLYSEKNSRPFGTALLKNALFRGKAMELLNELIIISSNKDLIYFTGIFSLMDAYLQIRMSDILQEVQIDIEVCEAVLHGSGKIGILLETARNLENGHFDFHSEHPLLASLSKEKLINIVSDAYSYSDQYGSSI